MDISSANLNQSTIAERNEKLYHIRFLYILLAIQLGFILLLTTIVLYQPSSLLGWFAGRWGWGLAFGLISLLLALLCYFLPVLKENPINWVLYSVFTLFFALFMVWLVTFDRTRIVYFVLWALFAVAVGLMLYFLMANFYISSLAEILLIAIAVGAVLFAFLAFSNISTFILGIALLVSMVAAFYISYQHRSMLRNSLWDLQKEDPVTGAVRIWLDGILGVFRVGDLFSKGFGRLTY